VPGGDLAFLREQLLDAYGIDAAILNPIDMTTLGGQFGDLAAALTAAMNDWTAAEWLERDDRLWGSICVPFEVAELAVAEIERLGDHPRFVQVLINHRTREPLGSRRYWPLYEAAVAYDLPIAVHVGGHGSDTVSGAGWPTYGFEDHVGLPQACQTQVTSLVAHGVFDRFPTLKIVLQEGGFAWLPSLMWRLDMAWELLCDEVAHVTRRPSETIREHFWFTTQPIEEPEKPEFLRDLMEDLAMDDRAMFASDYPHWDFDAPDQTLPRDLGPELRDKILRGNALALYPRLESAG
jgi:predicted TIM-barrel fold metal-dependent hydrolase